MRNKIATLLTLIGGFLNLMVYTYSPHAILPTLIIGILLLGWGFFMVILQLLGKLHE